LAEVKEDSSTFLHPRDTVRRKQLISRLRGIPPRNTLRFALSYAVGLITEHSRGNMSSVAVRAFLSESIAEVRGQVPARVFLQQIIQRVGVVRFGHVVVVVVVAAYDSLQWSGSGLGRP